MAFKTLFFKPCFPGRSKSIFEHPEGTTLPKKRVQMITLHLGDELGTSQANIAEPFDFFLTQVGSIVMCLSFELHTQDFVLHDWNV